MANFFKDVTGDLNNIEEEVLGPQYNYAKNIKNPAEMNMSSRGSIPQAGRNVRGLIDYTELLITGKGRASKSGGPMGNKFFLETGAKCKDIDTDTEKTRSIYINNVPQGNIPFISSSTGANFSEFKGLIPGTLSTMEQLNPLKIFQAFMMGGTPDCQKLTMQTIDSNNRKSNKTKYVALMDIKNLDACLFSNKRKLITKKRCVETFSNTNLMEQTNEKHVTFSLDEDDKSDLSKLPRDPVVQLYIASIGILGVYIMYNLIRKNN